MKQKIMFLLVVFVLMFTAFVSAQTYNEWYLETTFPVGLGATSETSTVFVDGKLYVFGDADPYSNKLWAYDIYDKNWTELSSFSFPTGEIPGLGFTTGSSGANYDIAYYDGKIYAGWMLRTSAGAGYHENYSGIWVYDIALDEWVDLIKRTEEQKVYGNLLIHDDKIFDVSYALEGWTYSYSVWIYDLTNGTWSQGVDLPFGMTPYMASNFVKGGEAYYGGYGLDWVDSQEFFKFNLETQEWISLGMMPQSKIVGVNALTKDYFMISAGYTGNWEMLTRDTYIYHLESGTWSQVGDFPIDLEMMASTSGDYDVFAVGGYSGSNKDTVYRYSFDPDAVMGCMDEEADNYDATANMNAGCEYSDYGTWVLESVAPVTYTGKMLAHALLVYTDDALHLMGGIDGPLALADHWVYDLETKIWNRRANLLEGSQYGSAITYYDGNIYVIGGGEYPGITERDMIVQIYNIENDSWSYGASAPEIRASLAGAIALDNKIYVPGGANSSYDTQRTLLIYDIESDSWSYGADLPIGRAEQFGSLGLVNGLIYVAGGNDEAWNNLDNFFVYDPVANNWSELDPMPLGTSYGGVGSVGKYVFATSWYVGDTWDEVHRVMRYNTETKEWLFVEDLGFVMNEPGITSSEYTLWVATGEVGNVTKNGLYRYDIKTQSAPTRTGGGGGGWPTEQVTPPIPEVAEPRAPLFSLFGGGDEGIDSTVLIVGLIVMVLGVSYFAFGQKKTRRKRK